MKISPESPAEFTEKTPVLYREGYEYYMASDVIFHLAIIDLGLPQTTHETAQPRIEPGIELVQRAAKREG